MERRKRGLARQGGAGELAQGHACKLDFGLTGLGPLRVVSAGTSQLLQCPSDASRDARRAGERGAGAGLTVAQVAPNTTWKSSEPKTELEDLMGLLQGRGHGALPGVSRWRPSYLFGRKRQLFLHCVRPDMPIKVASTHTASNSPVRPSRPLACTRIGTGGRWR